MSTFAPDSNITPLVLLPSPIHDVVGTDSFIDGALVFITVQEPPFDYIKL